MTDTHALSIQARQIKLLISDVDGVMTDGSLHYGEQQLVQKSFHAHDGFGLQLLMQQGIEVAVITGCTSLIVATRMKRLGIRHLYQGHRDKTIAYETLLEHLSVTDTQVAYIGDDLPDLPLIERVGLGVAVANANPVVLEQADWVTQKSGGQGAVREVCDLILQSQHALFDAFDKWQKANHE